MSLLEIRIYPDDVLTRRAETVDNIDDELRATLDDMAETMYTNNGIGLAGPQVGLSSRMFVVDVPAPEDGGETMGLLYVINPAIVKTDGTVTTSEGCLSFPGVEVDVKRSARVKIEYQDRDGQHRTLEADGLLAVCLQHEFDHLEGTVITDRVGAVRRKLALRELNKVKQEARIASGL